MKNKFQRLTKEEKKKVIKKYYETKVGLENKKRFKRIFIYGVICLGYGLFLIIEELFNHVSIANYIIGGLLLIASAVFLIGVPKIRAQKVNNYLVNKKK